MLLAYLKQMSNETWLYFLAKEKVTTVLEGNLQDNASKMLRDFLSGIISITAQNLSISNTTVESSRQKIFNKNNMWVDTNPLVIENHKNISLEAYEAIYNKHLLEFNNYKELVSESTYFVFRNQEIKKLNNKTRKRNVFQPLHLCLIKHIMINVHQ